jgi:hypothetical protein
LKSEAGNVQLPSIQSRLTNFRTSHEVKNLLESNTNDNSRYVHPEYSNISKDTASYFFYLTLKN